MKRAVLWCLRALLINQRETLIPPPVALGSPSLFSSPATRKKVCHIPAGPARGSATIRAERTRAIRGRVFPQCVCIEDVDKIISSAQRAPEEAAGRGEPGKHSTASESRFTPPGFRSARTKGPAPLFKMIKKRPVTPGRPVRNAAAFPFQLPELRP